METAKGFLLTVWETIIEMPIYLKIFMIGMPILFSIAPWTYRWMLGVLTFLILWVAWSGGLLRGISRENQRYQTYLQVIDEYQNALTEMKALSNRAVSERNYYKTLAYRAVTLGEKIKTQAENSRGSSRQSN